MTQEERDKLKEPHVYVEVHVYDKSGPNDTVYLKLGCYVGADRINVSFHDGDSLECDQPFMGDHAIQTDRKAFFQGVARLKRATQDQL